MAGARSVLLALREGADLSAAAEQIAAASAASPEGTQVNRVSIPVMYGGPDTGFVSELTHLSAAEIAARHAGRDYTAAFLGFSPGFAYLVGGDPLLRVPRLAEPRPSVPAGSVALAAEFTAVYPQSTPGGWRIVGRTDLSMFDPGRSQPSLLSVGDIVNFEPADSLGPRPLQSTSRRSAGGRSYVLVLDPGPMTTIQDGGRLGWAHLGVPRAGAADRRSAALANRLVGNSPGKAVLESTLSGPHLRLGCDRLVAVTGARATLTVDGMPARLDTPLALRAGCEIRVGTYEAGARTYVSFSGGVAADAVLGSMSTDTLSGLGPPPLEPGDLVGLDEPDELAFGTGNGGDVEPLVPPRPGDVVTVRAVRGPRDGWIGAVGMETLARSVFEVAGTSDRTGVRLSGPAVEVERREELPPEGMVAGGVQVPPSGSPIVLLRNHPTTGGYPVAAVVTDEGVDLLSQCRPGVRVRFSIG